MDSKLTHYQFGDVKADLYSYPWPHVVVDNFLPAEIYEELCRLDLTPVEAKSFCVHHNYIGREGNMSLETIPEALALQIHAHFFNKLAAVLDFLAPGKMAFYDYTELHLVQTGVDFSFPTHHDLREKLLSVVVYLDPKESSGTLLFDSKEDSKPAKVISWKQNRALLFSRRENITWHSYKGFPTGERRALVYNLMTNNARSVVNYEGNNYYQLAVQELFSNSLHFASRIKRKLQHLF